MNFCSWKIISRIVDDDMMLHVACPRLFEHLYEYLLFCSSTIFTEIIIIETTTKQQQQQQQ